MTRTNIVVQHHSGLATASSRCGNRIRVYSVRSYLPTTSRIGHKTRHRGVEPLSARLELAIITRYTNDVKATKQKVVWSFQIDVFILAFWSSIRYWSRASSWSFVDFRAYPSHSSDINGEQKFVWSLQFSMYSYEHFTSSPSRIRAVPRNLSGFSGQPDTHGLSVSIIRPFGQKRKRKMSTF